MNEFDKGLAKIFLAWCLICFVLIAIGIYLRSSDPNYIPPKETRYVIELRSLDGTLIDTIYPDVGTYWYEPHNIPQVLGNTVKYVSKGNPMGVGANKYLTASAPIIIVKEL